MSQQKFLNYLKFERRYSDHTTLSYKNDLDQFSAFLTQFPLELEAVNSRIIRSWVVSLMDDKLKPTTVNRKLSSLKSYYKFLMKEGLMTSNPAQNIKMLKVPQRTPEFVSEKEIITLLENLPEPMNYEELRDQVVFELFYATGMRRAELLELKDSSIDFGGGNIKVLGKGKKERKIPLHPFHLDKIKSYISRRNAFLNLEEFPFLFVSKKGNQLNAKAVYTSIRKYLEMCISVEKKSPHILRHTFATHLLNKGASLNSIKELLGHSSLAATQVYTHNSIDRLKEIHKQAHPKA